MDSNIWNTVLHYQDASTIYTAGYIHHYTGTKYMKQRGLTFGTKESPITTHKSNYAPIRVTIEPHQNWHVDEVQTLWYEY